MYKGHILGHVIRTLRKMAKTGAKPSQMIAYLESHGSSHLWMPFRYMSKAFLQDNRFLYLLSARPITDEMDLQVAEDVNEHRSEWETSPFPELMRLRDYFSFSAVAKQEQIILIVCGSNPATGRLIAQKGLRCHSGRTLIIPRDTAPNEGLLAADPEDARLLASLKKYDRPLNYSEYVARLNEEGLRVLGEETGYVVEDREGFRLIEGYRLHGAYDAKTYEPVWTGTRGEKLREALNRHLGAELVQFGPHDQWEHRNNKAIAGPLWGPHVPVIEFMPDLHIRNVIDVRDLTSSWLYRSRWSALYPHHPIEESL